MAKRKGSPRAKAAAVDEPLRRGRRDERQPDEKERPQPDVAVELLQAVRVLTRESEILPGIPLS